MLLTARSLCQLAALLVLCCGPVQAQGIASTVLRNKKGVEVHLISTGASVQRLLVPDARGRLRDVVLGFDNPADYNNNSYSPYFGAIVGRVTSRIANASFTLDGTKWRLLANENGNTQHGGPVGWSAKNWTLTRADSPRGEAALFSLTSPPGDQGFPHTVHVNVTYTLLAGENDVILDFSAHGGPTPISLISHSYFNLDGGSNTSTVLQHTLFANISYITPLNNVSVPYGTFEAVKGTPYDFLTPRAIGERAFNTHVDFETGGGYNYNGVLWGLTGPQSKAATKHCVVFDKPRLATSVSSPASGLALDVLAQTPGLEVYTGNGLGGWVAGKGGARYPKFGGIALEAEMFPNFVNTPAFANCILTPQQPYKQTLVWRFYNGTASRHGRP